MTFTPLQQHAWSTSAGNKTVLHCGNERAKGMKDDALVDWAKPSSGGSLAPSRMLSQWVALFCRLSCSYLSCSYQPCRESDIAFRCLTLSGVIGWCRCRWKAGARSLPPSRAYGRPPVRST